MQFIPAPDKIRYYQGGKWKVCRCNEHERKGTKAWRCSLHGRQERAEVEK